MPFTKNLNQAEIQTWKTVKLGLHKSPDEYRSALHKAGVTIASFGEEMLDAMSVSQEEVDVELVELKGRMFGADCFYTEDICLNALELGFDLCPLEVGPCPAASVS